MMGTDRGTCIARWFDAATRRTTTGLAERTSRRGFIGRVGTLLAGSGALPLLPVSRAFGAEDPTETTDALGDAVEHLSEFGDPESCDYWRYCALGGTLCACCGGSPSKCPPGAQPSPVTWIGTCRNPVDGKQYLISYNDCCGKEVCPRCFCHRTEGAKPVYFPSKSSNVLWCFGVDSNAYHCTLATVIGDAPDEPPAKKTEESAAHP
ncbi:MAG: methylamine dehydrogenase (amicyanin) light chain [Gammaproteobacteria bacterium]|nr:methylamine dehydrogenase (amicyanin) light chain [Gammaproteobacteria bacterium]